MADDAPVKAPDMEARAEEFRGRYNQVKAEISKVIVGHDEIVHGVFAVLTDAGRAKLAEVAPGHLATVRACLIDVLDEAQLDHIADALERVAGQAAETDCRAESEA